MGTGLATLWLAAGLIEAVLSWSGHAFDALRYGTPRTSQADGAIGQDRARAIAVHLTAENIDRRIWITILPKTERGPILMIRGPQLLGARRDRPYPRVAMRSSAGKAQIELRIEDRSITYSYDPRHHTFTLPSDEPGGRR